LGNLWGASLGENYGTNDLGLSSTGAGGDGPHEGIGLAQVGTLFGGSGTCKESTQCDDMSIRLRPRFMSDHKIKRPSVRMSTPTVSGRIAPEIIQRIVRQNFGQFRLCYENGLRSNPGLAGRVAVRFLIDRSGRVTSVANAGSDLPDSTVVACVVRSFSGLSFPEQESGIVSVTYPISLAPSSHLANPEQVRDRNSLQIPLRKLPPKLLLRRSLNIRSPHCLLHPKHHAIRKRCAGTCPTHQRQLP
ncbi:MAG: AgmX/PglI C-terminal domain-containing protein, partial [Myxococcales bacterium]|nr:AgmX/PglI C-terminal domain-containing protein [Polyangiaceae bacterium]MDW8250581.1 AgmX/PglI C-terminal domain-containing protein [Myxococcales bacterium]